MRRKLPALLLPLALGLVAARAPAAPAPWAFGRSRAQDLIVKLVTIEPGDAIYTWWGHSALIVEDVRLGVSRFYNYGLFSFEQDNFLLNFAMGRLWFQVGAAPTAPELASYKAENRSIRIQTLDLAPERRLEMAGFLEKNILPQNRTYQYDHYRDNCATRVRDLIDRMVDGQLASAASDPGRMTLRQHTRRYTARHFLMNWLLMFLMSGGIDRPIRQWEEMFQPLELERNVARLVYTDPQRRSRALVSGEALYYRARDRRGVPDRPPADWPPALGAGLALALVGLGLAGWRRRGGRTARWASGIYESLLGLLFGLPAAVLAFMSLFTDHTVTYGNRNLLALNPVLLLALPLGIALASGARGAAKALAALWSLSLLLALLSLALQLFPAIRQDNALTVALLLPVQAAGALGWLRELSSPRR
jgi:hypothetical protein